MINRKSIDNRAMSLMLLLSMLWGMQQVALKAAALDMPPLLQIAFRSGIASLIIAAIIMYRSEKFQVAGVWFPGIIAGTFFSLEYYFIGESLKFTSASHVTVLLYSAPIFVAFMLHFLQPSERLSSLQWFGISLAFTGIAVTFLLRNNSVSSLTDNYDEILWGDFLALLSGICWSGATVMVRTSKLSTIPAAQTLFYQILTAATLLSLAAIATDQTQFTMSNIVWASILYQGFIVCSASFLLWFWLLRQYPASQLGVFSFITPLFGIIFGVWLLNETVENSFLIGTSLVLSGITLVTVRRSILKQILVKIGVK